jgi:N-acetylmuramoyl-L-alanine amidase
MSVRILAAFVVAAVFLGGCAGPERKVTPLYREEIIQEAPPPATARPEQKISASDDASKPEHPAQPIEPKPEPLPAVVEPNEIKPAATEPATGWVSLQDWCAQSKLAPPKIELVEGQTNIVVRSDGGIFAFEFPRRNARWNGILLGVGFAPVFTNRQIFVNAIDLNKVLKPLLLTNQPPRKKGGIVVIDAGHGGANKGAFSKDQKLVEKELTLDWARRVQKLLEGSDWKVFMTRTGDVDLSLSNRVAFAEEKKADLFISLHFNSYSNRTESGLESYCMTPVGMSSHVTRGFADDLKTALPNNEFDADNFLLAFDLHRAMLRKTGRKDRGIRRARFMTVLKDQKRPAVLLEGGYLSNPEEAKLIATAEFRQKLAEAVAEALGVASPPLTTSSE